jgi:hypothetical protein
VPAWTRDLCVFQNVRTASGAHTVSYSVGTGGLSPVLKLPGREEEHSPPSSAEVKNERNCTPIALCAFMVVTGSTLNLPVRAHSSSVFHMKKDLP